MSRGDAANSRVVRALVFSALAVWLVGTISGRGWIVGVAALLMTGGVVAYIVVARRRPDRTRSC